MLRHPNSIGRHLPGGHSMVARCYAGLSLLLMAVFTVDAPAAAPPVVGNPWFSASDYATMNPEVMKKLCPTGVRNDKLLTEHYLSAGNKEGRLGRPHGDPLRLKKLLEAESISPVVATERDMLDVQRDFKVGDTQVSVVVRGPKGLTARAREDFRPKREGESVERYLAALCDRIRTANLGRVTVPQQTLVVEKSTDPTYQTYQLILRDIKDVGIDFSGTKLVFTDPTKRGMLITGDLQRVRLHHLVIDWKNEFASAASVQLKADGGIELRVPDSTDTALPIYQFFGFYDPALKTWNAQTGRTQWVDFVKPIVQDAKNPVYSAPELETLRPVLKPGQAYPGLARHHAPGKVSIYVTGDKVEDLQLTQLEIQSSAYMGVGVDRIKRGFLLSGSKVAPKPGRFVSTASDAVHLTSVQDVILENNRFEAMGDDGANVQGYTFVLGEEVAPGSFAVKSKVFHGQTDDKLIVYSAMMDFLGEATIAEVKTDKGDLSQHVVTLKDVNMVGKLTSGSRFGMISQHPRRVVIKGNTYGQHRSRGILVQASLVLVADNTITDATDAAILVTSDADTWSEGMGATSVLIQNNTIKACNHRDVRRTTKVLGAISIESEINSPGGVPEFAGTMGRTIGTYPLFQNILITGSTISDCKGAGIFVASARNVSISKNKITAKLLNPPDGEKTWGSEHGIEKLAPVTVFRSAKVLSDDPKTLHLFPNPKAVLSSGVKE